MEQTHGLGGNQRSSDQEDDERHVVSGKPKEVKSGTVALSKQINKK